MMTMEVLGPPASILISRNPRKADETFLKAAGTDEVRLELKDSQSAGQLRPAEGDDYKYRYIVMPMRI